MIEKGLPEEILAKVSGHADHATLYRHYVRAGQSAVDAVRAALDSICEASEALR
jgi:hypothetical protein